MSNYLITGGCGFIGSHIAEELLNDGDDSVTLFDNLSSGSLENIEAFRSKVRVLEADVRDTDQLRDACSGMDYVFHEAAMVSVVDSVERPRECHEVNITGTLNVLEAAASCGVKRVVLASSAAIYGNDPTLPKVETIPPAPESPYGLAKIAKEYYGGVFSRLYGLPVIGLRYFNVYGPRQDPKSPYSGVVSIFVDRLLAGQTPRIYGDGEQTRDFVFVKDIVQANLLAMHSTSLQGGEALNVGTGRQISLLELLDVLGRIIGTTAQPELAAARAGDVRHSCADIGQARKMLGYEPRFTLEEGLAELVAWRKTQA
jgi:nucleoside-diphosphate-sugar epimerase